MTTRAAAEKLFKQVNTFIVSCVDAEGYPVTKAVVPGKHRESLSQMYFCTNTSSHFATAVRLNPKAAVYFYSRGFSWQGCMLTGLMTIVEDMAIKQQYWQDAFKGAYPQQSYTDPDFCVLQFVAQAGRYYSNYQPRDFEI